VKETAETGQRALDPLQKISISCSVKETAETGQRALDTLFYTPDFGDLPDFDLPDELELPNIAQV
jgi:hypothetical protein